MKTKKLFLSYPIEIDSFEELLELKNKYQQKQKIIFICSSCNQKAIRNLKPSLRWGKLLCTHCALGEGIRQVESKDLDYWQKRNQKTKETCLQKYGVENPSQLQWVKDKKEQTSLKHYSTKCFWNSDESKKRMKEKYGVENIFYSEKLQKQIHQKLQDNGGCGNARKSTYDKMKKTCKINFGVDNIFKSKSTQRNIKKILKERYGFEHAPRNIYKYNNLNFDSKPELAFWIYCKDHNLNIKRESKVFEYYFNNKKHLTYIDFELDNKLIEIKGDHFLKEDGTWQDVWNHENDKLLEAKHQCLIKNNVKILYSKDYKKYLEYIKNKYGSKYLDQFKICKKDALNLSSKIEEIM